VFEKDEDGKDVFAYTQWQQLYTEFQGKRAPNKYKK
jgi:hypothetical protein